MPVEGETSAVYLSDTQAPSTSQAAEYVTLEFMDEKDNHSVDKQEVTPVRPRSQRLDGQQAQSLQFRGYLSTSFIGEILFVAVICASQLLTQAGLALSIASQHYIADSFNIGNEAGQLSWFSAAYSLTVGTFILVAGRFGDVFGHKRFFVAGFVWFGVWSGIGGFAVYSNSIFFTICRAMQGIGPAFMLPNAIAIIGRKYQPGRHQDMIFSLFGATAPGGFFIGAIFASLISQKAWWPWSYWIMGIACLLSAFAAVWIIPASSMATDATMDKSSSWHRIDILGSITGVAALVLFNFAWNQGPVVGWSTPYTYVTMIAGILLFVAFIVVEKRAQYPLVPFGTLKVDSLLTLACIAAGWSSFGIFVLYNWNFLQVLREQTALLTSVQLIPIVLSGFCAAVLTGLSFAFLGVHAVMLIAMTAFLLGGILIATAPVDQTYWAQTFVGLIVLPWGMDMSFPAATILLSRRMSREQQGFAASLVTTFVNYSISIGLGFAGTVESQVDQKGEDILRGYRGALYMGVGLAGLGVLVAMVFCFMERCRHKDPDKTAQA